MSKKKINPKDYPLAIQFSEQLRRTELWITKGEELLAAAYILEVKLKSLWPKVRITNNIKVKTPIELGIQTIYFMLIAYAIENFCKALLIFRDREFLRHRLLTRIPGYIKEHNLQKLVDKIQLRFNVREQELLARLSRNSIWAARYPVPTEPRGIRAIEQFSDGKNYLTAYFSRQDFNRIHRFLDRLRKYVQEELDSTV